MLPDSQLILATEDHALTLAILLIALAFIWAVLRDYLGWVIRGALKIKRGFERD